MIFNINSTRGQTRFLTCVARVTCLVISNVLHEIRVRSFKREVYKYYRLGAVSSMCGMPYYQLFCPQRLHT